MNWWGKGKTGLAKAAAVLATVFMIALGLCGVNAIVSASLIPRSQGAFGNAVDFVLIVSAYAEMAAMIVSGAGLLIIGLITILQAIGGVITGNSRKGGDE